MNIYIERVSNTTKVKFEKNILIFKKTTYSSIIRGK